MQRLLESSLFCPDIIIYKEQLLVSWTGLDRKLNVGFRDVHPQLQGTNNVLSNQTTFEEKSISSPCLVVHDNDVWISWSGEDSHLNVATMKDGKLHNVVELNETSSDGCCLASHNGKLYIAWRGTDPHHRVNVALFQGKEEVHKKFSSHVDSTLACPSVASFKEQLRLAWSGLDGKIHLATVLEQDLEQAKGPIIDSVILSNQITLEEYSHECPWLVAENVELKLVWVGIDIQHHLNIATVDSNKIINKQYFKAPYTEDTTIHMPHSISLHIHPHGSQNLRIKRAGNYGVRYAGDFFALAVNYQFPVLPHTAAQEARQKYKEYQAMQGSIYLYHI